MKLKYNGGDLTLSTTEPYGAALAIRGASDTYYAELVELTAPNKSAIRIYHDGQVLSPATFPTGKSETITAPADTSAIIPYEGHSMTIVNYYTALPYVSLTAGVAIDDCYLSPSLNKIDVVLSDGNKISLLDVPDIFFENAGMTDFFKYYDANGNQLSKSAYHYFTSSKSSNLLNSSGITMSGSSDSTAYLEAKSAVHSIASARADSTIFAAMANANNNYITVQGGGAYNIVAGGMGTDTIRFRDSGGMIADFGYGALKDGTGAILAKSLGNVDGRKDYDGLDQGSYYPNIDHLKVEGTIQKIYLENIGKGNATSKGYKHPTVDVVVTYKSTSSTERAVLLKDILKKPTVESTVVSEQKFDNNYSAASALQLYHAATGNTSLSASQIQNKFAEISTLPESLVPWLDELENRYDDLGLSNSVAWVRVPSYKNKTYRKDGVLHLRGQKKSVTVTYNPTTGKGTCQDANSFYGCSLTAEDYDAYRASITADKNCSAVYIQGNSRNNYITLSEAVLGTEIDTVHVGTGDSNIIYLPADNHKGEYHVTQGNNLTISNIGSHDTIYVAGATGNPSATCTPDPDGDCQISIGTASVKLLNPTRGNTFRFYLDIRTEEDHSSAIVQIPTVTTNALLVSRINH